jgi:hypothetical protein
MRKTAFKTATRKTAPECRQVTCPPSDKRLRPALALSIAVSCAFIQPVWAAELYRPAVEAPLELWQAIEQKVKETGSDQELRFLVGVDRAGRVVLFFREGGTSLTGDEFRADLVKAPPDEIKANLDEVSASGVVISLYGYNPGCGKMGGDEQCFSNQPRR